MDTQIEQPCWYLLWCKCVFPTLCTLINHFPSNLLQHRHHSHSQYSTTEWLFLHGGDAQHRSFIQNSTEVPDWVRAAACLGQCAGPVSCSERRYCLGTLCELGPFLWSVLLILFQHHWIKEHTSACCL